MPDTDKVVTRIPVEQGTIADLRKHLDAAVNLELWTIPLYLTALSSIQSDDSSIVLPPRGPLNAGVATTVTRLIVSVAIQEMYHLQLAGNLARLFGVAPQLAWPIYKDRIPYVYSLPAGVTVKLGTANDLDILRLMVAVETPDHIDQPVNRGSSSVPEYAYIQYDAAGEPCYPSIGTLYSIVDQLAARFANDLATGAPQLANGLFTAWWGRTGLLDSGTVATAVDVIVEQGEGALGHQAAPITDPAALASDSDFTDPFFAENCFSHFERFTLALDNLGRGVTVWPTPSTADAAGGAQSRLSVLFRRLLDNLRSGWGGGKPDLSPMFVFRTAMSQVYQAGEIPAFAPPGPDSPGYDEVLAALAPPQDATWNANVRYFFTLTDAAGMQAAGLKTPDLSSQTSVKAGQANILAAIRNAMMPPGELNEWSPAQLKSFGDWKGD